MTVGTARSVALLARAECQIALLDCTQPLEFDREYARLLDSWTRGHKLVPSLRYAPRRNLEALKRALDALANQMGAQAADAEWLAGRASELLLEARLASAVGTTAFGALARDRFPAPTAARASGLELTAREWIAEGAATVQDELTLRSDDRVSQGSLWSQISRRIGELHLPVRLRVDRALVPLAACGQDVIVIRGDAMLTVRAAARITEHEVAGHLLPRVSAKARTDVLHCGCAGATDDEEGRALLIERRLNLMDPFRRAELGARHLACSLLCRDASFVETVSELLRLGAPLELALHSALRANRGGGLGREIVYLPAMQRLERAFSARPELERWFQLGRASLAYAATRLAGIQAA